MDPSEIYRKIEDRIHQLSIETPDEGENSFSRQRARLIQEGLGALAERERNRLRLEFDADGPLTPLLEMTGLTEILINGSSDIWFERNGRLERSDETFLSEPSYERIMEKICTEANALPTLEKPSANGKWKDFRLHAIRAPLARSSFVVSLRRHPDNPWTLQRLLEAGWCTDGEAELLRKILREKRNFLVIGATGSGKTSVLNALLGSLPAQERCAIIEDTDEISCPKGPSFKLLTREASSGGLAAVDQGELVRQCLRMRPDRLVMGEIRGGEAKDFLMALSTGHQGSFGTLHADDPGQALLRMEMLIQMGAPHWNLIAIRKLIRLGLHSVVVTGKNENGERRLRGIHRLVSLEDSGFLLEQEF
ncbi:MAG TPA: ATPase, T2SS/T4P/T4SS family [Pseudobdellovibrionaceae bacterium]|nr:ATPase, T2SS/T4P/T4SS family [Pseudobdellovibrionaceae bacterium]